MKDKVFTGRMIPYSDSVMNAMVMKVMNVMHEHGLIEIREDPEAIADQAMQVLESHGMMMNGDIIMGRCVLLPSTPDASFSLLLATPCPADEYDADLRRKPSPVRFEQTERGEIVLPARWLITKLEELAANPAAPSTLQTIALDISRRGKIPDPVLPPEAPTVALTYNDKDGTKRTVEALPGGIVIRMGMPIEVDPDAN